MRYLKKDPRMYKNLAYDQGDVSNEEGRRYFSMIALSFFWRKMEYKIDKYNSSGHNVIKMNNLEKIFYISYLYEFHINYYVYQE